MFFRFIFYLGWGDLTYNFTSECSHHVKEMASDNIQFVKSSILSKEFCNHKHMNNNENKVKTNRKEKLTKEVACNSTHVQFLGNWNKSIFLKWSLQSGVGNEFCQTRIFGDSCMKVLQLALNFVQRFLFGSSRVECWGIATIQPKNLDWSL